MPGHTNTGYKKSLLGTTIPTQPKLAVPERPIHGPTDAILRNLQGLLRSLSDGEDARDIAKAYAQNLAGDLSHRHRIPTQAELADVCAVFCDAYLKATTPPNPG
jgi:hypothetical protein